jgi:cation transport regulator ChaC
MGGLRRLHPALRHPLVGRLSRASLASVVAVFVGASFALVALVAVVVSATGTPPQGFGTAFRYALANMWNPGDLLERPGQNIWFYSAATLDALQGILLPTFLLGAFVFKLFQRDPLVWRETVSVENLGGRPILRFRFYNSMRSPIVRVEVTVYARVRLTGQPGTLRNYRLPVVLRSGEPAESEEWAFGRTGVPYLVSVPLWDAHDTGPVGTDSYKSYERLLRSDTIFIPPYREPAPKDNVDLMVLASGVVLDTGQSFVSMAEYRTDRDLLFGHYQEIGVDYARPPREWPGWENFDGNGSMYVFGYGSLTKPDSVSAELGRPVGRGDIAQAELRGWRRAWNVGSDASSHPERIINNPDKTVFDGVVAVLGLVEGGADDRCNGAVFPVSAEDLAKLVVRERNYRRVDVSRVVTFKGKPDGCVVFVYVPSAEALDRLQRAVNGPQRRPVAIRASYLEQTRAGFRLMGDQELEQFDADPLPGFAVVDLTFSYRVSVVPDVDDRVEPA